MSSESTSALALRWARIRPAVFATLSSLGVLAIVLPTVAPPAQPTTAPDSAASPKAPEDTPGER